MIRVDIDTEHKCPDCGALVWLPLTALASQRGQEVRIVVRADEFRASFERHVMLNPGKHPTFVAVTDDGSESADAGAPSNG